MTHCAAASARKAGDVVLEFLGMAQLTRVASHEAHLTQLTAEWHPIQGFAQGTERSTSFAKSPTSGEV